MKQQRKLRPASDAATNPSDDGSLWVRAAVAQYEGPLTQYAARLVGDVDRARDVVQDTFLKLWTADRAAVDGHLGQWLFRVCRNRALDVCRKESRMTTLQENQVESRSDPSSAMSPAVLGETRGVLNMLEELPERQQEVIRLKFQGGLSYREIANVMDLTATHVGVLIHTGLKAIRERLNECQATLPEVRATSAGNSGTNSGGRYTP